MWMSLIASIFFCCASNSFGLAPNELGFIVAFLLGCGIISEGMKR